MGDSGKGTRNAALRSSAGIAFSMILLAFDASTVSAQTSKKEDFTNVINWLHDGNSKLKRKNYWSEAEGRLTTVTGRVTDVKEAGWVMPMEVEINPKGGRDRVSVSCFIKKDDILSQRRAAKLNVEHAVSCTGNLSTYSLFTNMLSVSINEAKIDLLK